MIKRTALALAISIPLLFFSGGCMYAQMLPMKDVRNMNYLILMTIEEYARTSTLYNDSYIKDFGNLFADSNKNCIYNDMMYSKSYQSLVSPAEYVRQYTPDGEMMLQTDIASLKFVTPYEYSEGMWHRKVSVKKTIKIIDSRYYSEGAGGILYDSEQIYTKEPYFELVIELVYDKEKDKCLIEAINIASKKPSTPIDAEKYSVIIKSGTKYDKQTMSGNNTLVFNEFDEAFAEYNNYFHKDEDVKITATEIATSDSYNVLKLKYKPRHMRTRARVGFAPWGAYQITTESAGLSTSSRGFEFGLDIGYTFSVGKAKMGPFIGFGISNSSIAMSMGNFAYSYPGMISDHNNVLYERNYSITTATEELNLRDFYIPLLWSAEHKVSDHLKLTWDLGAKFYFPMTTTLSPYKVEGRTWGNYNGSTTITESAEEGFGVINRSFSEFMVPVTYTRNKYSLSVLADLGLEFKIYGDFSGFIAGGYEQGLTWVYQSNNDIYFDAKEGIYPLVYSTQSKEDVAVRSFVGCVSYKRQAFWMSTGFKIKF